MIISKNQYLRAFGMVVLTLAMVRCLFPSVAGSLNTETSVDSVSNVDSDSLAQKIPAQDSLVSKNQTILPVDVKQYPSQNTKSHPVMGVLSYTKAFPDSNDVQYISALKLGVDVVADREEAENKKNELVFVAASPYYHVDPLRNSIPYLVPKAAVLLNDIGRIFFDSLYVKGIPLHQFIVTSVMRTKNDLERLKTVNHNASENSCHLHGTTFDIGYNRYKTVYDPDGPERRAVRDDTLKWVLSEVLRDMREEGRCYVKYEIKQGCFHVTVR
jgi:hypothetical protein